MGRVGLVGLVGRVAERHRALALSASLQKLNDAFNHFVAIEKRGVVVIGIADDHETLRVVRGVKKPPAVREWDDAIRIACDHQQRHMDSADEFAAGEPIAQQPLHRQERIVNLANFGERSKRRS